MKKSVLFAAILCLATTAQAVEPTGYYSAAEGNAGEQLRQALFKKITNHTNVGYDGLYDIYPTSDRTADGKVWDMYSTCTWTHGEKKCGNYNAVCVCYNREHSIPQDWFKKAKPMVADAFHVYPTDGKVNGQRSSYEYGECSGGKSLGGKALGKLGKSTFTGYTNRGTVFEPVDEYKGDFARTYFYMATCYADKCSSWGKTFGNVSGLSQYGVDLMMKWHRQDPVSQKEIDRNNAVYAWQKNRNPFIDHPELAEHIWGNQKSQAWYLSGTPIETVPFAELQIWPNPATDFVTVSSEQPELNYCIVSLSGQMLLHGTVASGESISVGGLNSGIYLLRLESEGRTQFEKLVIQ